MMRANGALVPRRRELHNTPPTASLTISPPRPFTHASRLSSLVSRGPNGRCCAIVPDARRPTPRPLGARRTMAGVVCLPTMAGDQDAPFFDSRREPGEQQRRRERTDPKAERDDELRSWRRWGSGGGRRRGRHLAHERHAERSNARHGRGTRRRRFGASQCDRADICSLIARAAASATAAPRKRPGR